MTEPSTPRFAFFVIGALLYPMSCVPDANPRLENGDASDLQGDGGTGGDAVATGGRGAASDLAGGSSSTSSGGIEGGGGSTGGTPGMAGTSSGGDGGAGPGEDGSACTPGARSCNEKVPRECDATGQWQEEEPCQGVCTGDGLCPEPSWRIVGEQALSWSLLFHLTGATDSTIYSAFGFGSATVAAVDDSGWTPVGDPDFVGASYPAFALSGSTPYLAFRDGSVSGSKATVMRFDGADWTPVGSRGFSSEAVSSGGVSLAFSDAIPHLALVQGIYDYLTVMRYNGSTWETVGDPDFATAAWPALAFDGTTPCVAFLRSPTFVPHSLSVMRLDGTDWAQVGNDFNVTGPMTHMKFYGTTPYAVLGNKITVMKFDGSNWVTVGEPEFANGFGASLSFSGTTPYLAFQTSINSITVMRFDGDTWTVVGEPDFVTPNAARPRLEFPGGTPHVIFYQNNDDDGRRLVMMKYE